MARMYEFQKPSTDPKIFGGYSIFLESENHFVIAEVPEPKPNRKGVSQ